MNYTQFTLFKNTPFTNVQNTIHFENNLKREDYFNTHFTQIKANSTNKYNFMRDREGVKVPFNKNELMGYNYCRYVDEDSGHVFYAYIVHCLYINNTVSLLKLLPDFVMTYTQGNVLNQLKGIEVLRQHYTKSGYDYHIEDIRCNDDVLSFNSVKYFYEKSDIFKCIVLIQSTVDLTGDFGTKKAPELPLSTGGMFDGIAAVPDIYLTTQKQLPKFTKAIKKYPWIGQCISKITLVPEEMFNTNLKDEKTSLEQVNLSVDESIYLYRLKNESQTQNLVSTINFSFADLCRFLGLNPNTEKHLLRNGLVTMELTDYKGQKMVLDSSEVNGVKVKIDTMGGYVNDLRAYVDGYGGRSSRGHFYNFSLGFSDFDQLPNYINNGELSKSLSAYKRDLEQKRLAPQRARDIINGKGSLQDRFFSAVSIFSDAFSGGLTSSIGKGVGMFNDEYEYYRDQKAEFKSLSLTPPSSTDYIGSNAPLMKQGHFGIHFKMGAVSTPDMFRAKKYYNMYGFEVNDPHTYLDAIDSQSLCNWVQFKGNWNIPDIDQDVITILQTQFEAGVRLWHYRDGRYGDNPMIGDILTNTFEGL